MSILEIKERNPYDYKYFKDAPRTVQREINDLAGLAARDILVASGGRSSEIHRKRLKKQLSILKEAHPESHAIVGFHMVRIFIDQLDVWMDESELRGDFYELCSDSSFERGHLH